MGETLVKDKGEKEQEQAGESLAHDAGLTPVKKGKKSLNEKCNF